MVLVNIILIICLITVVFLFRCCKCRTQKQFLKETETKEKRIKYLERAVEKIAFRYRQEARLNESKSKFMFMVAHDLRQPLTAMQGYTSMLLEDAKDEQEKKILHTLERSSAHMGVLLADLVDASISASGHLKINPYKFIYNKLVEEIYEQYVIIAKEKNINLRKIDYPSDIEIYADRERLSQVLNNLVSNALKFTNAGGTVEISYQVDGNYVRSFIKDTGKGIVHVDKVKIFEKFNQAENLDDEHKSLGWGLGLAIAQDIIGAHKGIIWSQSVGLGKGTLFWFSLPLNTNSSQK
jgi:Signal transduction histidine kinase